MGTRKGQGARSNCLCRPRAVTPSPDSDGVPRSQRASLIATHTRQSMCRAAPQHFWNIYAALDGDIRARAISTRTELQNGSTPRLDGRVHFDRHIIEGEIERGASDGERTSSVEPDMGSHQRYFERRYGRIILQQGVCKTMRVPVHRAADRYTS